MYNTLNFKKSTLICFMALWVLSCSTDDDNRALEELDFSEVAINTAVMMVNGEEQTFEVSIGAQADVEGNFDLTLRRNVQLGLDGEQLSIININTSFNRQEIFLRVFNEIPSTAQSNYLTIVGGDAIDDRYDVQEDEDNFIRLIDYNTETDELSGTFQLFMFLSDEGNSGVMPPPENITFLNGRFRVLVDELELFE